METGAAVEEFITIVPVGDNKPAEEESAFITVLTVGATAGAAKVVVCRPRGARLGLGLKFEGGSAAAEKVRRLLVQSCAEDSPAANASTPWGKLIPGDEILAIDEVIVSELTRIECVRRLKDSDESLELLVRHFETEKHPEQISMELKETLSDIKQSTEIARPSTLPPPVPPRKLGKKNSFKDKSSLQTLGEQNTLGNIDTSKEVENIKDTLHGSVTSQQSVIPIINKLSRKSSFDSHLHRQNKESIAYLRKGSPEQVRRLVRRLSDGKAIPPEADVYMDLLSNEWERCLVLADAESDDTGSSISTVVDRLGSMASSVENSIPSTPIMQPKSIDIQKVLNSIENIDSDILRDMTSAKLLEIGDDSGITEKKPSINGVKNLDIAIPSSFVIENRIIKKVEQNDKNNNLTQISKRNSETNDSTKTNDKSLKQEIVPEKPKPMPRNTKVERSASEKKRRPIPIPELLSPPISEPLLTPTKKTCIESWLQRSEIEMNNKTEDKLEDNSVPEILPRLIDFVPKTQYKDSGSEPACTRPTTAPPPPPAETREDGSGASLDTIGELDESCDVTDNVKPANDNEANKRKSLYERNFWDDRVSKSDAEDKSLSNDETPLPSCPRQPPDGVETPSDAIEKTPDLPTRLPPRLSTGWNSSRPRFSYSSRTQDARSEASVKDKIAMFSVDHATSSDRLDKCGTLPIRSHSTLRKNATPYTNNYSEASSLDRRLTKSQDNLDETPRLFKRNSDRPEVPGALEYTTTEKNLKRFNQPEISNKPLFYGSTTTLPSDSTFTRTTYHVRSVSDDNSNKNVPTHKSNLEYLIEQRKKSMSKLRGLVIPEMQVPIVDLPEIKVLDSLSKPFLYTSSNKDIKKESTLSCAKSIPLIENKWKPNFIPNNIPKYSPAFKRKSLQVYTPSSLSKESTPERKLVEKVDTADRKSNYSNSTLALKPVRSSFEFSKTPLTKAGPLFNRDIYKNSFNGNFHDFKNVEIKICTATDIVDSDNDSAMSSTQSSYRSSASSPMHTIENIESDSSRLSPRISHYNTYSVIKSEIPNKSVTEKNGEDYTKRKICRSMSSDTNISLSSSAGSAATSGSQASCSSLESSVADSDKRKVSKVYNVDTINRRNIVASAKCRSGRDVKLKSPVVETKFSHESHNRSPSPINKTSDRLSTLTSAVSAIGTKGENRRRNKVIVDSDSDSDSEVNIRQRKSDFKNTRLKRNSSLSNKCKQNETNQDVEKVVEAPRHIKDVGVNETNKGCLEYCDSVKTVYVQNKNNFGLNINGKEVKNIEKQEDKRNGAPLSEPKEHNKSNSSIKAKCTPIFTKDFKNTNKHPANTKNGEQSKPTTQLFRLIKGAGSGVGLILAGGLDCEAKDVTVHRVLEDGIAAKAGIKRGSKVRSINGNAMAGLTHAQSVTVLKEQRSEVIIEIENEIHQNGNLKECGSEHAELNGEQIDVTRGKDKVCGRSVVTVMLEKAGGGAGLGFGLDGGRDSPQGDRPLTIKKLFAGGAAAQSGRIIVGAELISAGGQSMEGFTRTQAWAALKALPAGRVPLVLRNPDLRK